MKDTGAHRIYSVIHPRVAGKARSGPPATEEEARLNATGKTIWRLSKDTGRHYNWVNMLVTGKLVRPPETGVRDELRRKIEEYEREAGFEVKPWGHWKEA